MELTPFERAQDRLLQTNATIRTLVALDKIVRQMDEVEAGMSMLDYDACPEEQAVFLEALKEKRQLNNALVMCSNLFQKEMGIEA